MNEVAVIDEFTKVDIGEKRISEQEALVLLALGIRFGILKMRRQSTHFWVELTPGYVTYFTALLLLGAAIHGETYDVKNGRVHRVKAIDFAFTGIRIYRRDGACPRGYPFDNGYPPEKEDDDAL